MRSLVLKAFAGAESIEILSCNDTIVFLNCSFKNNVLKVLDSKTVIQRSIGTSAMDDENAQGQAMPIATPMKTKKKWQAQL